MSPAFRVSALLLVLLIVPSVAAAAPRTAFVTSTQGTGDLSTWAETTLDGFAGADQICRVRAAAAGLANSSTYRAWVSLATTDAYCHLFGLTGTKSNGCNGADPDATQMGPWVRVDGSPFAGTLFDLVGSEKRLLMPIRLTETGSSVPDVDFWIWTGTVDNGTGHIDTCNDWSTASAADHGLTGVAWYVGRGWTLADTLPCTGGSSGYRLLCLEPGAGDPLHYEWANGALAFVTSVTGNGNLSGWSGAGGQTGLAAGDSICRARAAAGHLPNPDSFFAWLSDGSTNAKDRLDTPGAIVRVDGIRLAASEATLLSTSAQLDTGLNVTEYETYLAVSGSSGYVWTGSDYSGNSRTDHCAAWNSSANPVLGGIGAAYMARYTWITNGSGHCDQSHPLYCFSNVPVLFWDHFERGDTSRWSVTVP